MKKSLCIPAALLLLFSFSCSKSEKTTGSAVAVFIPGIMSGNPVYDMLGKGIVAAVADYNAASGVSADAAATVSVIEAGTNQAEWSAKLTAVAASGDYDVIFSSNPSLPDIAAPLTTRFPDVQFVLLDAFLEGNSNIATVRYNQREQAYLTGYIAGLVSSGVGSMPYASGGKKIALIAAQEYPVMNTVLYPAFCEGAFAADSGMSVEFRVVGNWYDASKAETLARALYQAGTDVILPIAGGASQGVVAAAKDCGFYITWFDDNGFAKAPGYVISSSVMEQYRMAYELAEKYLRGELAFGTAETVGISDGYVHFVQDDPLYVQTVAPEIREKVAERVQMIESGTLVLPMP